MNNDDKENLAPAQYNTCRADHIPRLSPRVPLMPMIHASELTMVKLGNLSLQNSARIIIVFDCGRMAMSADRSKLSSISSVLRRAVSDPRRRSLRLRNDFPFAVRGMLDFLTMGFYRPITEMSIRYPLVTLLDLHIHCYLIAVKYSITALASHATNEFLTIAGATIATDFVTGNPDTFSQFFNYERHSNSSNDTHPIYEDLTASPPASPSFEPGPHDPRDYSPPAQISKLLNAICLLYRHTTTTDALRPRIVELLKLGLGKLMQLRFFVTMLQRLDLGPEMVRSLEADGLRVEVEARNGWAGGIAMGVKFESSGLGHVDGEVAV